jgi:uncharacterized protein YkuJ
VKNCGTFHKRLSFAISIEMKKKNSSKQKKLTEKEKYQFSCDLILLVCIEIYDLRLILKSIAF